MACISNSKDIFGTLPLELSQNISQYFQVYQIFQARRVSRRWNAVLSDPYIVDTLVLRPWYTEKQSNLRLPESLSQSEIISRKCEHVDAFRNGRAFGVQMIEFETLRPHLSPEKFGYADGILAWLTEDEKSIRLKCLVSGKSETLASPYGELIESIRLDGCNLVAITLSMICYSWKLVDGVQLVESLESTSTDLDGFVIGVVIADSNRAICTKDGYWECHLQLTDIETGITHEVEINVRNSSAEPVKDLIVVRTPGEKSIVLLERVLGSTNYVYFTRIARDGKVESRGHFTHPNIEGWTSHDGETWPVPQLDGRVTLWKYSRHLPSPSSEVPDAWLLLRVCYVHDHLEVQEQRINSLSKTAPSAATGFFWWKDVVYLGNHLDQQGNLEVIDLKESTLGSTKLSLRKNPKGCYLSPSPDWEPQWFLLGDETFVIGVLKDGFVIWCFDRHLASEIDGVSKI